MKKKNEKILPKLSKLLNYYKTHFIRLCNRFFFERTHSPLGFELIQFVIRSLQQQKKKKEKQKKGKKKIKKKKTNPNKKKSEIPKKKR